jgi:hypothetical protein
MRGNHVIMLTSSFRKRFFVVKSLEVQRPLANLDKAGGLLVCPEGEYNAKLRQRVFDAGGPRRGAKG